VKIDAKARSKHFEMRLILEIGKGVWALRKIKEKRKVSNF